MKFTDYRLSEEIKFNLQEMGFKRPTDIQFKCIPIIQKKEDLLGIAQTGTGKTAAFAIPLIDRIQYIKTKTKRNAVRVLVMVPTRELAKQLTTVFNKIGKKTGVKTTSIYGGLEQENQISKLSKGTDIVIATPGRMFDLHHQRFLNLEDVETLVLDEADRMLGLGFEKDILDIISRLPRNRQTLFFSATINKQIKKQAYKMVKRNAIQIQISPKDPVNKNITHQLIFVEMDDKRFFLQRLINENDSLKFLVFVRTRVRAERVLKAMERVGIDADAIHGAKDQMEREKVLSRFKKGENRVLIATDVTARGIDIPDVDYVVNYDLPEVAENYVHRVGRTGRGKKKGLALSFCAKEEKELLEAIEEYTGYTILRGDMTKRDYQETIEMAEEDDTDWRSLLDLD
jgi:ATP-dependent RNA helicase RhlE